VISQTCLRQPVFFISDCFFEGSLHERVPAVFTALQVLLADHIHMSRLQQVDVNCPYVKSLLILDT
jgi:hypothetical protein